MYLLIWNGTVHSYGDAGKKDGIVHAGGDDHGSRADEKYYALRNVSVHGESGCGSGDGCGILFVKGRQLKKLPYDELLPALLAYIGTL